MKTLFLAAVLGTLSASAAELRIQCPDRYPADDVALPQGSGWDAGVLVGRRPLQGGGMAIGPLAQRGERRGSERRKKGGFQTRFGFDQEQDPPEKWFVCYYGLGGQAQLARRVADTTTACTLTHEERKFPQAPKVLVSCH